MAGAAAAVVSALHNSSFRYVLVVAGGGASAAGQLLGVPGGSRTVLEVAIPYGEQALADFLGVAPPSFCSAETARALAARALDRARWLSPGANLAGVACTASLRSDVPKRGDHRFHIAVHTARLVTTVSVTLAKGARERQAEEAVVAAALLNAMAEAFAVSVRLPDLLLPDERPLREMSTPGAFAEFLSGARPTICIEPDGRAKADTPRPKLLLPGSFNPLHHGHAGLVAAARELTRIPAAYELSVVNADKPPIADDEIHRRISGFAWRAPLWLTRAPTFPEKARLFPGATFIVGADTAARIVDPRFYNGGESGRDAELADFCARDCRLLVAGRVDRSGTLMRLQDISIPAHLADLFSAIPEERFRMDVSSTQLRSSIADAVTGRAERA
jgi:hypothetical protein